MIIVEEQEVDKPEVSPDLLMLDGNGILHPNRAGIASHLGIELFQYFNLMFLQIVFLIFIMLVKFH